MHLLPPLQPNHCSQAWFAYGLARSASRTSICVPTAAARHGAVLPAQASTFPVTNAGGLDSFGFDPILAHPSSSGEAHVDNMHASAAIMNSLAQVFGRASVSSAPEPSGVAAAAAAAAAGLLDSRDRADLGVHSNGHLFNSMDGYLAPAAPVQLDAQRTATLNVAISRDQLVTVSEYAHRLSSMSGAKINFSPADAPGVFNLVLLGSHLQVDTARMLLCRILGLST